MKKTGPDRTLESSKIFPYLAWGLIGGFVFFVYHITLRLQTAAADLAIQTEITETIATGPIEDIKNFEAPQKNKKTD